MQANPDRRMPSRKTLLWLAVFIAGLVVTLAQIAPAGPSAEQPIPNRGQLMLAAAAYASLQAETDGTTVLSQHVDSVKLRPDGDAVAIVRMRVQGTDHAGTAVLRVVLRRSMWRGLSAIVLNTRVTG